MRILIVGAGIAGLSLAAHLQKQAHDITIIEKDASWDRRGYAIILHYNGLRTLQKLGIVGTLVKEGRVFAKIRLRDIQGKILKEVDYTRLLQAYGPSITILRKALHHELLSLSTNSSPLMGTTVSEMREDEKKVHVTFSDKTQSSFDLVVAADGVGSRIREVFFAKERRKYFGGEYWTAIIPSVKSYDIQSPELILHNNKSLIVYHYDNSERICITFGSTTSKKITERISSIKDLKNHYADFSYFVPEVLQKLPSYDTMYHGFVSEVTLKKWHTKRVVLIGDAAHAIHPINGSGTSMVLEDTYVLAEELANVTKETVATALENFSKRRKKRVELLQKDARSLALLVKIGNPITNIPRKVYIGLLREEKFVSKLEKNFRYRI